MLSKKREELDEYTIMGDEWHTRQAAFQSHCVLMVLVGAIEASDQIPRIGEITSHYFATRRRRP